MLLFRGALTVFEVALPTTARHAPSPPCAPSTPPIRAAQVALPALIHASTGVSLADDWRYEWAVLLLWTVPAYVVCEIISTSWHYKMASRMSAETAPAGPAADATAGGGGVRGGGGGPRSLGAPAVLEIVYSRLVYVAFLLQASGPPPPPHARDAYLFTPTSAISTAGAPPLRRAVGRLAAHPTTLGAHPRI